jgi:hypothetical protein
LEGNLILRHWNKRWARTRIHGTTKRQVWQQFVDVEKGQMGPVQERPFPFFKLGERKVDVQGHIEVQGNFYSVPYQLIGTYVKVHFNTQFVQVLKAGVVICQHGVAAGRARASSLLEHRPPYKPVSLEAEERLHLERARAIGPNLHRLIDKLLSKQDVSVIKRVRGMMRLRGEFSGGILEEAAGIALARYNHSYHFVNALCETLTRESGRESPALMLQEHELIRPLSEYQTHINQRT